MQVIPVEDDDELASIQQEIDFLAACDHPNVVRYLVLLRILTGCFRTESVFSYAHTVALQL